VQESADSEANIIFGAGIDPSLKDEIHITVIATGFEKSAFPTREPKKKPFRASLPYGSATATMNPYENRQGLERQDSTGFEAPSVQNLYENQEAAFFPGTSRPTPQQGMAVPPPASVPGYQQPYPYVQQAPQYQAVQPQGGMPYPPQQQQAPAQPSQAEKDDLGVPAYLRRSVKK